MSSPSSLLIHAARRASWSFCMASGVARTARMTVPTTPVTAIPDKTVGEFSFKARAADSNQLGVCIRTLSCSSLAADRLCDSNERSHHVHYPSTDHFSHGLWGSHDGIYDRSLHVCHQAQPPYGLV